MFEKACLPKAKGRAYATVYDHEVEKRKDHALAQSLQGRATQKRATQRPVKGRMTWHTRGETSCRGVEHNDLCRQVGHELAGPSKKKPVSYETSF